MMLQIPVKKKHQHQPETTLPANPEDHASFSDVVLCLVEKRMGASRKAFLTSLARRKGFCVEGANSERVTHVVSEGNSGDEVVEWMKRNGSRSVGAAGSGPALLDLSWFTESMSAGQPVEIEPRHCLGVTVHTETLEDRCQVAAYACQRRTPLAHKNQLLVEALETVAEEALFCGSEARNLAFSRAASVVKSLPWTVTGVIEIHSLPCIGEHSRKIIQEVLEDGASAEVENIRQSERYQTMKHFIKIFGVGVKTAGRWYQEGLRTISDLQVHHAKLNSAQQAGLLHYRDLNTPVKRSEAEVIVQVVQKAVDQLLPGASVTLTGGFRRGKPSGHDVDLLITHPTEGQEVGLLSKVICWLDSQGFLLYHSTHRNTFQTFDDPELSVTTATMDHFDRCFSIFCLNYSHKSIKRDSSDREFACEGKGSGDACDWKAVRVDLVVTPNSQFSFALLGWTGSKNFERELRRFSKYEKKMMLNSHTLYHTEKKMFLSAASEEEIFQHLGLDFIPPEERNA
ncbi:DNA-directed DNA/RNA polymerase mu [Sphaerodactylus townsendi]|uniref:DNA-directed DNA/RNA polymerase mu n=1 Tax=Sphaerodactylus townsendi TaxID=933632 RepID=UPI0020260972|nr:DNA-directed DNA/RNA polymerase mu [Sphaerodactylus townsendi]XP_048369274.1 DNA-directed DNA/RNA polymerase mu [Sphaerodactylus townsendi]